MNIYVKILLFLIPLSIFGYLFYANFFVDKNFNYFYDIGSQEDSAKPYLSPLNRTSDVYESNGITLRDVNHQLIYLTIPFVKGSETLHVKAKLRISPNDRVLLGVKKDIGWNYTWSQMDVSSNEGNEVIFDSNVPFGSAFEENGKLSISFNVPDLLKSQSRLYSIDWINITVFKPRTFS